MLFGLFKKINRVIIEGGVQDDWWTHHLDFKKYHIPGKVNRIVLSDNYKLDLMGRLNPTGDLDPVHKTLEIIELELDYPGNLLINSGIDRTTTIIVDDRRVYHDKGLMIPPNNSNAKRLSRFLDYLKNEGGFEKVYRKYGK